MASHLMNSVFDELSNMAVLSVKPMYDIYVRTDSAAGAGERFLQSATLLDKGQFLCLPDEMTLRMRTMLVLAFSNTKMKRISECSESPADNGITMNFLLESVTESSPIGFRVE